MIISALGFVVLENILILANYHSILTIEKVFWLLMIRFLFAVFSHTLFSAIFGFFLILSFNFLPKRRFFFILGLLISSFLHTFYNLFIIQLTHWNIFFLLLIFLSILFIFVLIIIRKLKKLKSLCFLRKN